MPGYQAESNWSLRASALQNLERLALVTGNYVNVADGVSFTLHRLVDALEARGVEVTVVAPPGDHPQLDGAHHMIHVPSLKLPIQKGYRLSLALDKKTMEAIDRFDPQLIHVATPDIAGVMAVYYARKRGLALTSTYHTNFATYLNYWGLIPSAFTPLAWALTRRFYSYFDQVYVPTTSLGDDLVDRGILEDYAILARGVDRFRFHRCHRSQKWRARHGIDPDEKVVLFCARIVWEKGLRTLVEAMDILDRRGPPHRVVVVGDGDQKRWLQRNLKRAIFTGYLTGHELACAYASADVFVYPSTTDTFGNVTLEAMASGLPIVGARAPGTQTLVDHEKSGLLVEPDDAQAVAEATARLLFDPMERERLGDGAARRARKFRWPEILDRFALDLDAIVAERNDGLIGPQA